MKPQFTSKQWWGSARSLRPIIVISREELNRAKYVLAVICTSTKFASRSELPNCVAFPAGRFGFTLASVAQCENIHSIDKRNIDLADGPIGKLDESAMREVIKAIAYVIESDCEPL